jgi:hypothetical protein
MSVFWRLEFEGSYLRSWKMCAPLQRVASVFPTISISDSVNKVSHNIKVTPIILKSVETGLHASAMRSARTYEYSLSCSSRFTTRLDDTLPTHIVLHASKPRCNSKCHQLQRLKTLKRVRKAYLHFLMFMVPYILVMYMFD